jgi:hypothetical protein
MERPLGRPTTIAQILLKRQSYNLYVFFNINDTGEKFIAVSLTLLNSFPVVSLAPAINFRFLVSSDRYQRPGNMLSPVSLTPGTNCCDDRGLFFLQNCEPHGKNKDVTVRRQQYLQS